MKNILFITAGILVISWAVCIVFSAGLLVNILLGIAIATVILLIIRDKELFQNGDIVSNPG